MFDGLCNFCSKSVEFIIKQDKKAIFRFAAIQSRTGGELIRQFGMDPNDIKTFMLVKGGRAYIRSEAVLQIVKQFQAPWRFLLVLRLIPRPVRDWAYTLFANNRYRWFGKMEKCMVPSPDINARFMD
ncbi:MAG: thiol-disulfide oxidoreductase DCC family protein [Nitrospinae bacterium]|nr:thiol-disulfide oxidoreductase DCC family protein [Nitrospinota bacterium]